MRMSLRIGGVPYTSQYDYGDLYDAIYEYYDDTEGLYDWLENPHPRRGDIKIELMSPQGTNSVLLPYRNYDFVNDEGYDNWPFMSVHFWSENPVGEWTLKITYKSGSGYVYMSGLSMTLYGTATVPAAVSSIPTTCDPTCARGCFSDGPLNCDSCQQYRVASTLECVDQCPVNTHANQSYCYPSESHDDQHNSDEEDSTDEGDSTDDQGSTDEEDVTNDNEDEDTAEGSTNDNEDEDTAEGSTNDNEDEDTAEGSTDDSEDEITTEDSTEDENTTEDSTDASEDENTTEDSTEDENTTEDSTDASEDENTTEGSTEDENTTEDSTEDENTTEDSTDASEDENTTEVSTDDKNNTETKEGGSNSGDNILPVALGVSVVLLVAVATIVIAGGISFIVYKRKYRKVNNRPLYVRMSSIEVET